MTASDQARLANQRRAFTASTSTKRGNDTTAYTAGDVVGKKMRKALTSIANGSEAALTLVNHGLVTGDIIQLTTNGTLPDGLSLLTNYYVFSADPNEFFVGATLEDVMAVTPVVINTSSAGSGTHTFYPIGSAVIEFAEISLGGNAVAIRQSILSFDLAAVPGSMTSFRLHLFAQSPPSQLADNDAWTMSAADLASYLGYIDLGTPVDVGPVLVITTPNVDRYLVAAGASIYGYMVTAGAYTPAAGTVATIKLLATEI